MTSKKLPSGDIVLKDPKKWRKYILERIHIDKKGCWIWQKGLTNVGYGSTCIGRKPAHIMAYEAFKGPIPEKADLLHKCNVRPCCNPDHLKPGSRNANMFHAYISRTGQMSKSQLRVAAWMHNMVTENSRRS